MTEVVTKSKTAAFIAILVAVSGLLMHPDILGVLPEKWAVVVSGVGILLQAITRSVISDGNK